MPEPSDVVGVMRAALDLAAQSLDTGDVPVGAVVLAPDGVPLAGGSNRREGLADPTGHAEIIALRAAGDALGTWRLDGCTLVVTLEPCTMCAGALVLARVARLVFGAWDPKAGAAGSVRDVVRDSRSPRAPTPTVATQTSTTARTAGHALPPGVTTAPSPRSDYRRSTRAVKSRSARSLARTCHHPIATSSG